jgi:hypothetical protein
MFNDRKKRDSTYSKKSESVTKKVKVHRQQDIRNHAEGVVMTQKLASSIFLREFECYLSMFDSPFRLLNPFVVNRLVHEYGEPITRYLPKTLETMFRKYIEPMDRKIMGEIKAIMRATDGCASFAVDGVTVLGKSQLLYTVTKGGVSLFEHATSLQDQAHVKEAEINDIVRMMSQIRDKYGGSFIQGSVDNAAADVMTAALKKYAESFPDEPTILTDRDPSHCIDLVAKDSAVIPCFSTLHDDAKKLITFLTEHRIKGIKDTLIQLGKVVKCGEINAISDTRFNKLGQLFQSLVKQKPFLDILRSTREFKAYYSSRSTKRKKTIDDQLNVATPQFFLRLQLATQWFVPIEHAQKLTSSQATPKSAYFPIVQALRNELYNVLEPSDDNGTPPFDEVFNHDAAEEAAAFIDRRFNMSGKPPVGAKVGLLDEHAIWCHLVDPFKEKLGYDLEIIDGLACVRNKLIRTMVRGGGAEYNTKCNTMLLFFNDYCTRQGVWKYVFELDRVDLPSEKTDVMDMRLSDVAIWLEETGGLESRLSYIGGGGMSNGELFHLILKPLLSMGTSGSVVVERAAKPLKNYVLSKHRNKLGLDRANTCLRIGLNLNFLAKKRGMLKGALMEDCFKHLEDEAEEWLNSTAVNMDD